MYIREYEPSDCPDMAALFYDTVHRVNCRDYAPAQLDVWATGQVDLDKWNQSFLAHHTLVAIQDGILVGFGDMTAPGIWTGSMSTPIIRGRASPPPCATPWKKPSRAPSPPTPPSPPGLFLKAGATGW